MDSRRWRSDRDRNDVRQDRIDIGFFSSMLPIVIFVDRDVVSGTPVFDGKSAGCLFIKQGQPFGKQCVMDLLFGVHDSPP